MNDLELLKRMRKECFKLANRRGDANLQSIFSSLEIIWTIYIRIIDKQKIINMDSDRDFFLCSKGQATLGLMMVLSECGIVPREELDTYGEFKSRISMQADRTKFNCGVEISAGSLGHGLPMAAGIALSKKIKKQQGEVFVLVGDGEMHEGTNWEACSFIGSNGLSNVCLIVDDNDSHSYMYRLSGLEKRLEAFGFDVICCDGHDIEALSNAFSKENKQDKPKAVIARTRRGYGSKTLMTKKSWFHRAPSDDELPVLLNEVDEFDYKEANNYVLTED